MSLKTVQVDSVRQNDAFVHDHDKYKTNDTLLNTSQINVLRVAQLICLLLYLHRSANMISSAQMLLVSDVTARSGCLV